MGDGVDLLVSKSVRQTLTTSETSELNEALCDPDAWMRAAEVYGIASLLRPRQSAESGDEGLPSGDEGLPTFDIGDAQSFGSMIIKNPHVADWFSVFCPVPGGMSALRSALRGASPVEAFEGGVAEILGPAPNPQNEHEQSSKPQSADDRTLVAAAALCSGIIAFARTDAILGFLGLNSQILS